VADPKIELALGRLSALDWEGAHAIVQGLDGRDAAWIHAHLHRVEGDLGNAAYWYRLAGRPLATNGTDEERSEIVVALGR
jgi:hypothetical protein